jgi:hypothetical protein
MAKRGGRMGERRVDEEKASIVRRGSWEIGEPIGKRTDGRREAKRREEKRREEKRREEKRREEKRREEKRREAGRGEEKRRVEKRGGEKRREEKRREEKRREEKRRGEERRGRRGVEWVQNLRHLMRLLHYCQFELKSFDIKLLIRVSLQWSEYYLWYGNSIFARVLNPLITRGVRTSCAVYN